MLIQYSSIVIQMKCKLHMKQSKMQMYNMQNSQRHEREMRAHEHCVQLAEFSPGPYHVISEEKNEILQ